MLKNSLLLWMCFWCVQTALAKKNEYPVTEIPEVLKPGASAVVRIDSTFLEIDMQSFNMKRKFAVTVLNENGNDYAKFRVFYDLYSKVSDISGKLYDAEGVLLKSLNTNQIIDRSTFGSSYSFYDDNRVKYFDFDHKQYPYTVVFEYEYKGKSNFFLPAWEVQSSEKIAVQKSMLILAYKQPVKIKYKSYNFPEHVRMEESRKDSFFLQKWVIDTIPAFVHQPASVTENYYLPTMEIVADKIALANYQGTTESWQNLGKFIYELNKDKDILPDDVTRRLHEMTDSIKDKRAKVAFLYHYMQQHTRYVANEYGLAGWQTFDAASLSKSGYGDCKGLSNYMKAMLKAIDIPSNLVVISAGQDRYYKLDRAFSSNVFNHMILCVPLDKDSVWLECTSSALPAGYLGSFTQDRDALLLSEDGGKIVKTPAYNKDQSYIKRDINITIDPAKELQQITWASEYKGTKQDDLFAYLKGATETGIRARIINMAPYKSADIVTQKYDYSDIYNARPYVTETITFDVPNITDETAKRMMINIPIMGNPMNNLRCNVARTKPIVIEDDYRLEYNYKIILPAGAKLEGVPTEIKIENTFATYNYTPTLQENVLTIQIRFTQNKGIYKAALFDQYQAMYQKITQNAHNISLSVLK
ncbi:hypothetical protein DBR32_04255 [Taibaiella sp. KBW10]|uniref:DUF3857 domain-containing protein n=1 Tax=Taibaiella sp. KBW10 TaxID=2153357 RepID=UPI000F59CB25|nr:DUF3857 domain-containing transglutaminase family protein [Taibaiella sp. KBW10]RQO32020.1 hypothetical protein DBR32_04255 [Taibaiella sp. KBW10]